MIKKMPKKGAIQLKAVELFCGIGGFRIACDKLNIKTIWANDINALACSVYADNFGDKELHIGDIREFNDSIPKHDLLTAGFPCQPFSSAGKKLGIKDPRGTLFNEIIKVLRKRSPSYFVLENVKRLLSMENGDNFATIILALSQLDYFIEWRLINATNFGLAQNRERVVIIGTHVSNFEQGKILLAPIEDLENVIRHYSWVLKSIELWKPVNHHKKRFPTWGLCYKGNCFSCDLDIFSDSTQKPYLSDILEESPDDYFFMEETTNERLKKSVFINRMLDGVRILFNQNGGARMGYTIFGTDGVAPTLTASHSRHYERYKVGNKFRRLTNIEYARLQGFPDNHCHIASIFNQYILFGNALPPQMANWAIQRVVNGIGYNIQELQSPVNAQMSLFK